MTRQTRSSCSPDEEFQDIGGAAPGLQDWERLCRRYARTRDAHVRETLILHHQPLVRSIAARFLGAGEELDDLVQVGNIGLIRALECYEPQRGARFSTYATATIRGEIKRYFRDKAGPVKIPRAMREMCAAAQRVASVMRGELGRAPTLVEVAARLGASEEATQEALAAGAALMPASLEAPLETKRSEGMLTLLDCMGRRDGALETFAAYEVVRIALAGLSAREQEVIRLRFFEEMSQSQIAARMQLSQMHVSRLQRRGLGQLRRLLNE